MKSTGVRLVEASENLKLGLAAATYAAQTTCPPTCPLRKAGCYAEKAFVGFTTRRINAEAAGVVTAGELAAFEAELIDGATARLPLRVHVVGDCPTPEAARLVGGAMARYDKRGARHLAKAWTYTHSWRAQTPGDWQGANVLASCDTPAQAHAAKAAGWATAIVVPAHPSNKRYQLDGLNVVPCPNQIAKVTCDDCQLCMKPETLKRAGITIGFAKH